MVLRQTPKRLIALPVRQVRTGSAFGLAAYAHNPAGAFFIVHSSAFQTVDYSEVQPTGYREKHSRNKLVSHSMDGDDMLWMFRVFFDLLA